MKLAWQTMSCKLWMKTLKRRIWNSSKMKDKSNNLSTWMFKQELRRIKMKASFIYPRKCEENEKNLDIWLPGVAALFFQLYIIAEILHNILICRGEN